MRHVVYILLFCLFMGCLAYFSSPTQNALAAPQVIKMQNIASLSEKQTYDQHANEERIGVMKLQLDKFSHPSEDWLEKAVRSNFLRNAHTSEGSSQQMFDFPWSSLKTFDISSLWKQQRNKQKKKDVYDYGE